MGPNIYSELRERVRPDIIGNCGAMVPNIYSELRERVRPDIIGNCKAMVPNIYSEEAAFYDLRSVHVFTLCSGI